MVKVKLTDGPTIRMIWHYDTTAVDPIYGKPTVATRCQLSDDSEEGNPVVIASAVAIKSAKDQHCKEKARMTSLGRAISEAGFDKEQAQEIIFGYKNRPRPKNEEKTEQSLAITELEHEQSLIS
jgi:hypothetical protein